MTSVCTGAYYLAEAGLLDGRRATTYPGRATSFRQRYPGVSLELDRRIVDEGSVISAGATTSYLDLALNPVERFAGHPIAVLTAKVLAVDKNRLTQRPYYLFADQREHRDDSVAQMQDWIEEHHRDEVDIAALGARFAMSVRTLNRRLLARGHTDLAAERPAEGPRIRVADGGGDFIDGEDGFVEEPFGGLDADAMQVGHQGLTGGGTEVLAATSKSTPVPRPRSASR